MQHDVDNFSQHEALPSPDAPRFPHLQLDDGAELAPRRVPDDHQLALDDDGRGDVEAVVILGGVNATMRRQPGGPSASTCQ